MAIPGHTMRPDEHVEEWEWKTGAPGIARVLYAAIVEDAEKVA